MQVSGTGIHNSQEQGHNSQEQGHNYQEQGHNSQEQGHNSQEQGHNSQEQGYTILRNRETRSLRYKNTHVSTGPNLPVDYVSW